MTLSPLKIITIDEQHNLVSAYLRRTGLPHVDILEAGCGRQWYYDLQGIDYKLTGIDLDSHALEARKNLRNDLDEVIVGDLRTAWPPSSYDVIYNSYVLEHIENAREVMDNFCSWLRPNGLLILYIPDRQSVYGFISKVTPHWLHVLVYRYVFGRKDAGKPGNAPYRTYYDEIVSRRGIREYARDNQLEIREECGYYKPPGIASLLLELVHFVSFGRLKSTHCDLLFVLKKIESDQSSVRLNAAGAGRIEAAFLGGDGEDLTFR